MSCELTGQLLFLMTLALIQCITMLTSLLYKDDPVLFKPSTKMLIIHPVMCNISVACEVG